MATDSTGRIEPDSAAARFFESIAGSHALPDHVMPADAASAVLCTLSQRLSGGEARDLVDSMSPALQALIQPCAVHRGEAGEKFDRAGFLARVGHHLRTSPEQAEAIARAVFTAFQQHMSWRELDDVESQLPPGLKDLWRRP